jgi:hypothetical protein
MIGNLARDSRPLRPLCASAMFMKMDDVGALFWRFGKLLPASHAEHEDPPAEHSADHKAPPTIVHSPAAD